ncbi:MAG: cohesin domain-containing protein [Bryobacteraceae bacterium]
MRTPNRFLWILVTAALLVTVAGVGHARTRKGDRFLAQGREAEVRKDLDKALALYEEALREDPSDVAYQMASRRVRFQAAQYHVGQGQKLRTEGRLAEALAEFQRGFAIDPSSAIAEQEVRRTLEIIERDKKLKEEDKTGAKRGMTAIDEAKREVEERLAAVQTVPELRPLSRTPISIKMNNQPPKVMFEAIGKRAGVNVLFDPDYSTQAQTRPMNVELTNASLDEALDYLAIMTRSFWKPISSNAVFVTADSQQKRAEYEDTVARVFYLINVTTAQELNEISSTIRTVANAQRVFIFSSQNAIIVRGTASQVALAELLIHDLDRPRPEVVVDIMVMEVNRTNDRSLSLTPTASDGTPGISTSAVFNPQNGTTTTDSSSDSSSSTTTSSITLAQLGRVSSGDYSVTLPSALLEAVMSRSDTRILQSPQVRVVDGQKASLKIGERQPYSTGGVQTLAGTTSSSLYSSFQYLDVGVNVDLTPKVHGPDEVSLHVELEISSVNSRVDIGGYSQPVVGQRKVSHDIRLKEGEMSLMGGLIKESESKSVSGVPGLSSIPVLGRLFSSETVNKSQSELLIVLVPHVVRTPDLHRDNFKGIATGSERVVKVSFAPQTGTVATSDTGKPAAAPGPAVAPGTLPSPIEQLMRKRRAQKPEATQPVQEKPEEKAPETPPGPPAPQAQPQISFSPGVIEAKPGSKVTVKLQAENMRDLFSAPMRITFDPAVLKLTDVARGELLSSDGKDIIFTRNILNEKGEASINLGRQPGAGGIDGSGTLVTLTFEVIGEGTATIAAPDVTLNSSQMQPVLTASPQVAVAVK